MRVIVFLSILEWGIEPGSILSLSFVAGDHGLIGYRGIDLRLTWMRTIQWKSFRSDRTCPCV